MPQALLAPVTKEVVADTASGGAWINRNPWQVIRTGVNGSTPGNIHNTVSVVEPPSPFLIEIVANSPSCGLNAIQQVANKWQSTSPYLVGQTQKLDSAVDVNLTNDIGSASIFSKIIGHKLSDGSSSDLYMRSSMNFAADSVQTQTPQLMDLGFLTINALGESSGLSTTATRIQRPADGSYWSASDQFFGETTAVGVSESKSDNDYNYKTEFQIWK